MEFKSFEKYTYLQAKHDDYLQKLKHYVSQTEYLPKYHIYPSCGLMNDPNGLSYYNDEYHIFYQWFPFEPNHGMKHWGHVKSKDLVNWEECPVAIVPDQEYEKNGAYSGNAIEKDGLLYLFYTANYKTPTGKIPKQAVAIMDKEGNITKSLKNPIIDGAPVGFKGEIRDPYVFKKEDKYYMFLGAWSLDDKGTILIYESDGDLESWRYRGTLDLDMECGYMLECPSYLNVDGKDVFIVSPMGLSKQEEKYHNRFASIYLVGTLDLENNKFIIEHSDEIDAGFDFYAPQTFRGDKGQPLMFGWFGCGEQPLPSDSDMWKHALTTPRALKIEENKLKTFVAPELLKQFKVIQKFCDNQFIVDTNAYRFTTIIPVDQTVTSIKFGQELDFFELEIDTKNQKIRVDRESLAIKVDEEYGMARQCSFTMDEEVKVDVFVDNSFVEIFINEGEKTFCLRTFNTKHKSNLVTFNKVLDCCVSVFEK